MQDFRQVTNRKDDRDNICEHYVNETVELQNYNEVKNKDMFRFGGQRWRRMSSTEKMPYVEAAKLAQQQNNKSSQQNNKSTHQNKPNSSDTSKKSESQRDQKKKKQKVR